MELMTRKDHLAWCKKRALECVERDSMTEAYASFHSDMGKHDETKSHIALTMGPMMLIGGQLQTADQMTEWINGSN
jgi:hypothetical protein